MQRPYSKGFSLNGSSVKLTASRLKITGIMEGNASVSCRFISIIMPGPENDIEEPITSAPPEVEKIIREVIRVEKEHLHADRPKVKADILQIIKDAVR